MTNRRCFQSFRALSAAVMIIVGFATTCGGGDAEVRSRLFDTDSLSNPLEVCRQAAALPLTERFEFLSKYVLPVDEPDRVRIDFEFAPWNGDLRETKSTENLAPDENVSPRSVLNLTRVVSPAVMLVETAEATQRNSELRARLARSPKQADSEPAAANRLTLEILLALAEKNFNAAGGGLSTIHERAAAATAVPAERAAELMIVMSAARYPETSEAARDLVFLMYEQARRNLGPRSERWHRHMYSLKHLLEWFSAKDSGQRALTIIEPSPASSTAATGQSQLTSKPVAERHVWPLRHWHPVSRITAETSGTGYPTAAWSWQDGRVSHVASHDHDYLYFGIPLEGDFDIEADLTTFSYRDIHLAVGGIFAGPGYDLKACLHGNFRHDSPSLAIMPPLSRMFDRMRVRIRIREGIRTTEINGREVFRSPHTGDPWVAIHSPWYTNGSVRNLRIHGDLTVPDEINLLTHSDLPGWLTYYDENAGGDSGDWRLREVGPDGLAATERTADTIELIGHRGGDGAGGRRTIPSGSFCESLLRYHRPVLEDGVIRYEFFYEPGRTEVAPTIGRLALILSETGVREHWMTDGRFERSAREPASGSAEFRTPPQRQNELTLPLKPADWNRVELHFSGDMLRVRLNAQFVYERPLNDVGVRQFGLFHYSDQTEVRVRRLFWRGDWPRSLPPVDQQELAGNETAAIDARLAELPAAFEHDFARDGLPLELFTVHASEWRQRVQQLPTGLKVTQPGGGGYPNIGLAPQLVVGGDFDVIVEFSDFETQISNGVSANLHLLVGLNDADSNDCRLYRKHTKLDNGRDEHIANSALFTGPRDQRRYIFPSDPPEEATSGRLRLARRGDVMHYLLAENDSPWFRLIGSKKASAAPTRDGAVRLILETLKSGSSSVVWKKLLVRAESLTGAATLPRDSIKQLNESREQLAARRLYEFKPDSPLDQFVIWGQSGRVELKPDGLHVTAPGFDDWRASGIASGFEIAGDFDVAIDFEMLKFEPAPVGKYSMIYLQSEFRDPAQTAVEIKLVRHQSNSMNLATQIRQNDPNGETKHRELTLQSVPGVTRLRLARRGAAATLIVQESLADPERIVARVEIGTHPVPSSFLRMLVHTGGAGRETIARLKSLEISADKIE